MSLPNNGRGQIPDRVNLAQKPKILDKKERFGDLEIELVFGGHHKEALLNINDRATGMLAMKHFESKEAPKKGNFELIEKDKQKKY